MRLVGVSAAVLAAVQAANGYYLPGIEPIAFKKVRVESCREMRPARVSEDVIGLSRSVATMRELTHLVMHHAHQGDPIVVWANELNSRDSALAFDYRHYDFCQYNKGEGPKDPPSNLGQRLFGDRLEPIPYEVRMLENVPCTEVWLVKGGAITAFRPFASTLAYCGDAKPCVAAVVCRCATAHIREPTTRTRRPSTR